MNSHRADDSSLRRGRHTGAFFVMEKNPEIESLRAIAILFVLLHHLPNAVQHAAMLPAWFSHHFSFWSGVDLFFVISGFVITRSLGGQLFQAEVSRAAVIKSYAIKRIFRLLPAAWLWLAVPVLIAIFLNDGSVYPAPSTLINDAIFGALNVANLYYPYCFEHGLAGVTCSVPQPVGPYWSLSLEEQFYLVLPMLFVLLRRSLLMPLFAVVIAVGLFWQRPVFSYAWFSRVDGFTWGVLLALLSQHRFYGGAVKLLSKSKLFCRSLVIALLLLLAWAASAEGYVQSMKGLLPSVVGTLALASAGLMYLASLNSGFVIQAGRLRQALTWLGARSYALYLVHTPLLMASKSITLSLGLMGAMQGGVALAMAAVAIVLCTEMTYRLVEVPARNYGKKLAAARAGKKNLADRLTTN